MEASATSVGPPVSSNDSAISKSETDVERNLENEVLDYHTMHNITENRNEKGLIRTVTAQDWNGPDDPENPYNWSLSRRIYNTTIPAILAFVTSLSSSIYTPGVVDVAARFNVSLTAALLGLSLYTLGLGFGPLVSAPISETYGRRVVYWGTLPLFSLFTLGAGFSNNLSALLLCRFFAGFFGGPCIAVGAGTNADIWMPIHRAVASSFYILSPFLGPALGPVIGGFAAQFKGFRWTQWCILFLAVPIYLSSVGLSETYKKAILKRRAKHLDIAPPPGPSGKMALKILFTVTLIRPVEMIFVEPIVGFFSLYIGFNFAVVFCFVTASSHIYSGVYHFTLGETGLTFLAIGLGCVLGVITVIIIDRVVYQKLHKQNHDRGIANIVDPEHRLYSAMVGSFGIPIALFWFAWTARTNVHWICPIIAEMVFGWGNICVFVCVLSLSSSPALHPLQLEIREL
ncbi:MAG: hypothetical protein M1834_001377 [Cirrosporium novae-zelandiae]|nr:MAG: hypothetical protein M1834_001377 [Cirrosporium novae-zelandiae]